MILFNVIEKKFPEYIGDMSYVSREVKEMVNDKYPFLKEVDSSLITKSNLCWIPVHTNEYQEEVFMDILKYGLAKFGHAPKTPELLARQERYESLISALELKNSEGEWEATQKQMFDLQINMQEFINYAFTRFVNIHMQKTSAGFGSGTFNEQEVLRDILNLFTFERTMKNEDGSVQSSTLLFILVPFNENGFVVDRYVSTLESIKSFIDDAMISVHNTEEEVAEMERLEKEDMTNL